MSFWSFMSFQSFWSFSTNGWRFIRLVLWGGLAYTAGAVFEFLRWPALPGGVVGPHEIFHLAVLAGIGCHWAFILRIAAGESVPRGIP